MNGVLYSSQMIAGEVKGMGKGYETQNSLQTSANIGGRTRKKSENCTDSCNSTSNSCPNIAADNNNNNNIVQRIRKLSSNDDATSIIDAKSMSKDTNDIKSSKTINVNVKNYYRQSSESGVYSSSPKPSWWQNAIKNITRKRSSHSESQAFDGPDPPLHWYLCRSISHAKDPNNPQNGELITCLDFCDTGSLLAVGDKGGRVTVYKYSTTDSNTCKNNIRIRKNSESSSDTDIYCSDTYDIVCKIQSHEREFDFRKTVEIDERLNQVRWLKNCSDTASSKLILTANEKVVKLWRIQDLPQAGSDSAQPESADEGQENRLGQPWWRTTGQQTITTCKKAYGSVHDYTIHSLSLNPDQQTFISADDLRINLWNLEVTDKSFNIVDMRPENIEDLQEVITSALFHPSECNLLAYGSNKGCIRLCDLRALALCDQHYKTFEEHQSESSKSYFSEIISSIVDLRFSFRGHYLLARDYFTLKIWDIRSEGQGPLEVIQVQDHLRPKLTALYESDHLFDRFQCAWSPNDRYIVSGSYSNLFRVHDRSTKQTVALQAESNQSTNQHRHHHSTSNPPSPRDLQPQIRHQPLLPRKISAERKILRNPNDVCCKDLDFNRKILNLSFHPNQDLLAATSGAELFLIMGKKQQMR